MCGIAGLVDRLNPPSDDLLRQLSRPLERRGPDDYGACRHGDAGLVHRRLSIIDLEGGHQPLYNEDKSLALVFNGEIYDFQLLHDELAAMGHVFATRSDSEVLLHLYEEEGPEMVHRLNGMFAFAILHVESGDLFMARDRFGQKPFFYAFDESRFAFASGPLSLGVLPWVDTTLDCSAIHDYLELQYVPTPRSIFRGIAKLPPGHRAFWQGATFCSEPWYQPEVRPDFAGTYEEACGELRQLLTAAVKRRLVADVPLGLFLSGGLDSSIICALARQELGDRARTYSIAFPDPRYDEREYARRVAEHLGTEHHFLEVNPEDLSYLRDIVGCYEEPYADASMLPTSLLSRFTRQHVTVALSGDAADEMFGGYYRHRVMHLARPLGMLPLPLRQLAAWPCRCLLPPKTEERSFTGRLRRVIELVDADGLDRYWRIVSRLPAGLKETLYGERMLACGGFPDSREVFRRHLPPDRGQLLVEQFMELDLLTYLNDDILTKVDRASMAYGLEVRSPFLDRHVADLALSLPYKWKQCGKRRKIILADTFGGLLPGDIPGRRKMGFGVPVAAWLRGAWQEPVRELLLDGKLTANGFFRREALEGLLADHVGLRADHSYLLFSLLVLELWMARESAAQAVTAS